MFHFGLPSEPLDFKIGNSSENISNSRYKKLLYIGGRYHYITYLWILCIRKNKLELGPVFNITLINVPNKRTIHDKSGGSPISAEN